MVPASALPTIADLTTRTSLIVKQLHSCLDPLIPPGQSSTTPIARDLADVERKVAWLISRVQCALLDAAHQRRCRAS